MLDFLKQRWFLMVLIAGVALGLTVPAPLQALTHYLEPRFVVASALLLIAWTMPTRELWTELTWPWAALWSVLVSYLVVPAAGWWMGEWAPKPDIGVGLLLAASVPCTLASAVLWTRLGGGNEATALLAVMLSTCSSWIITPLWLQLATGTQIDAAAMRMHMMFDLAWTLILPLFLGQGMRQFKPLADFAHHRKRLIGIVSQLLIVSIVLKASSSAGTKLSESGGDVGVVYLAQSALLAIGLHLGGLIFGYWSSKLLGIDRPRRIAVAVSCSQKTLPVSLFLFEGYFKDDYPLAVAPLLFFHVGQLVLDTFIADRIFRKEAKPKA